ncbi:MAG TPA: hypothetical protein VN408_17370 [Actinoplanes sp.]|nr:hypothetical protein [Actinoplanes sp.]
MIRNDTDKVAYQTLVRFDAVDAAGRTVVDEEAQNWLTQVVPVLRPGDSAAVGTSVLIGRNTDDGLKTMDSIKVTVQVGRWVEPGDGSTGLGPVTATVISGSGQRDDAGGSLRFDSESANCAETTYNVESGMASRGISLVFRDTAGRIVGGFLSTIPQHDICLPGRKTNKLLTILQRTIPSWADLDQTSISVYCDFELPAVVGGSGAPVN